LLRTLDLERDDIIDSVFALLDTRSSWFGKKAGQHLRFCEGATTGHIACHVGVLQRGGGKLDREGRDYWIKPLRDLGAIEAVYLDKTTIRPGHPIAKSPHSGYRLEAGFVAILKARGKEWEKLLRDWIDEDTKRRRLEFQGEQARLTREIVDSAHADLISACCEVYAPKFLPGFEVVYVDDSDGDRVSSEAKVRLEKAGLRIELSDAMPDVLLWNPTTDSIWVIEAVTSDGEADEHKVARMREFADRNRKKKVGFTTVYATWKRAAERQGRLKNLAVGTRVWIREDGSKQFLAESFEA